MMAGSSSVVRTLVLVGRTGNGKSATGNTILGRKAFQSKTSPAGVTKRCELQQTVLEGGQIINVIDTPGLFDSSIGNDSVAKEIVKCIDLAQDGVIHAVLIVFSIKTRFSEEEVAALHGLRTLFGSKIINYMIVVFTRGDELEDNDETLENYLGPECPQPLKDILVLCGNRKVLFNNKTKDDSKRKAQVQELLSLVDMVINQNDGKPFTEALSTEAKVDPKLIEEVKRLEQELAEKQAIGKRIKEPVEQDVEIRKTTKERYWKDDKGPSEEQIEIRKPRKQAIGMRKEEPDEEDVDIRRGPSDQQKCCNIL